MVALLCFILTLFASPFKSKSRLVAENAVLSLSNLNGRDLTIFASRASPLPSCRRRRQRPNLAAAIKKHFPAEHLELNETRSLEALNPRVFDKNHFGRTVGSPPGLPGGGMTGIAPPCGGVGALMSGSTLGGQMTPSVCASLSLKVSAPEPEVDGAALPAWPCAHALWSRVCGAAFPGGAFGGDTFCAAQGRLAPSSKIRAAAHPDRLSIVLALLTKTGMKRCIDNAHERDRVP
jgi:hypothetical protein